jgi:hypothetical protein
MRRVIRLLETPTELDKEVESAGSPSLRSSTGRQTFATMTGATAAIANDPQAVVACDAA